MPLQPYFKFIIPGAALSGEGGSLLILGVLYSYIFQRSGSYYGGNILTAMYSAFIAIGIISLCIGLPLLIVGLVKRSQYNNPY